MISQKLQDFLTSYCGIDEDLDETTQILRGHAGAYLTTWLVPELDAAIQDRAISPAQAEYLMSRSFDDADDVAEWLAYLRKKWFG